jgi:hypothetical protein
VAFSPYIGRFYRIFIFTPVATNAIKHPDSQRNFSNSSRRTTVTKFFALGPQDVEECEAMMLSFMQEEHADWRIAPSIPNALCSHSPHPQYNFTNASLSLPTPPNMRDKVTLPANLSKKLVTGLDPFPVT